MIERLIRMCAAHAGFTVLLVAAVTMLAILGMRSLPLDALPDLTDTQVIFFSDWPGRAPDIVESQVTYPLVTKLRSSPRVKYVRGVSMQGASQIVVVFEDGTDLSWARSRMIEKLASMAGLPPGVVPRMGPDATGLGWVFQYALVDRTGQNDLAQLRTLQDWTLRFVLQSVKGVAEVATVGGFVKEYQVLLDPLKLQAFALSPLDVARALRQGNQEIGVGVIEMGGSEFAIRGRGYVSSIDDLRRLPVQMATGGLVTTIGDVASVQIGPAPRAGAAELDGLGETVGGIVVMRIGENALDVINGVKKRLEEIRSSLPPGVEIVSVYDRSDLISRAMATLKRVLFEEIIVVALIVSLFLWHARASFVAILPLPIAVLLSFLPMLAMDLTVNIMSLGGIALAIGAMVDSGIILVENAHKKLEGLDTRLLPEHERRRLIIDACVEMGRPLFFSLLVITVSFLPIFALTGREGKLFHPLAFTKTVSMAWAAVLAVTLIPALAIFFLKGKFVREEQHAVSRFLHRYYEPCIVFVLKMPKTVVVGAALCVLATVPIFLKLRSEFMPALNEGTILYMPTAVAGMSLDTAVEMMQRQNTLIKALPEVAHVFAKAGRADTATDPAPVNMFETIITLKPEGDWRKGITQEKILAELGAKLDFPGMPNIWWQPIQTRIEMLSTGVRTAVGIKVLGSDLATLEKAATDIEETLRKLKGTRSVFAERAQGGNFIDIEVRRDAAALQGLTVADVQSVLEAAVGGMQASTFVQGRERYALTVRYAHDFRADLESLGRVVVPSPNGKSGVPLSQVAQISVTTGPAMINSENSEIVSFVFVDVDSTEGLSEYVDKARKEIASKVSLPQGVRLEFAGQYEALENAKNTLRYVVPATLLLIIVLLYLNTGSAAETAIVLLAVPFSLIGAFWLMWALDYKLSVASWVGLLALAGLDAETGVVMLLYLTQAWKKRMAAGLPRTWTTLQDAIHEGAVKRVRPKIMTVAAALIGLLPIMWSQGTGAEVMKRIVAPMVGGLVTSGLLELLVYPALFALWQRPSLERKPMHGEVT